MGNIEQLMRMQWCLWCTNLGPTAAIVPSTLLGVVEYLDREVRIHLYHNFIIL